MLAIENGIFTPTTKDRLEALEESKRNLEYNIDVERFKNDAPMETKDSIIFYLNQFKNGDIKDLDHQRQIINSFIETIILDEEQMIIQYRYSDAANGTREIAIKNTFDVFECVLNGGPGETRTLTPKALDPKSSASTNFATGPSWYSDIVQ